LRYLGGCEVVVYNVHTEGQGEVDVIGLKLAQAALSSLIPCAIWATLRPRGSEDKGHARRPRCERMHATVCLALVKERNRDIVSSPTDFR
jgi:transposase